MSHATSGALLVSTLVGVLSRCCSLGSSGPADLREVVGPPVALLDEGLKEMLE
jgi:hypothetical protein